MEYILEKIEKCKTSDELERLRLEVVKAMNGYTKYPSEILLAFRAKMDKLCKEEIKN